MADDQTSQQTRVLLVNGQTIILQGDAGDNSINEINADLLQQALREVSTSAEDAVDETSDEYGAPISETEDANDNLVAIFQGDQGETHTIQLTVEQAEALGLHFSVDDDDKTIQPDISEHTAENNLYISDESDTQLVYSEETKQNADDVMFGSELDATTSCADMVQSSSSLDKDRQVLESSGEGMGVLSSAVSPLISDQNQPITLIPQFIDGQVTYTVKIQEDQNEGTVLHNRQFTNVESELKSGPPAVSLQQTNIGVTLSNITSFARTPLPTVSCSSTSAPIQTVQSVPFCTSSVQQSVTLPISSVQQSVSLPATSVHRPVTEPMPSVQQPVTVPVSSVQQSVLSNYQCSRTSGCNTSTDKQTKVSYVILPGNNTNTSSSVTTKLSNTPLGRLSSSFVSSSRNQSLINTNNLISTTLKTAATLPMVLSTTNSGISTQVVSGTNSSLTGIPVVSPNTNVISSTSILAPVATSTSVAGGMIRVVAGGTATRTLQPIVNSNTDKFTSILAPSSGRLIATTSNVTTAPKIVSINPSSVSKTATSTTPEVSNMVSAALTRMPVPNFNSTKPLGSSENPIQLVQHGQTFHSVQSLTQEQLRQIATVLQQQHLESAPRTKNVVYDAETNTRIIYRVVYPEDLDLRDPRSPDSKGTGLNSGLGSGSNRGRGRRGRPPKSNMRGGLGRGLDGTSGRRVGVNAGSVDMDFDEDRLILDDTAKGERKKQLARTRSGRLSRPPRHMVKDYKRLHHLDFADADLDDSDGGYSDYQMSEHEAEDPPEKTDSKELLPGLAVPKRKISSHFRCPTCQKIYLGYSRMSRHFEMYPDHGSIDQLQMPNQTSSSSNNNNNDEDQTLVSSELNETAKVGMAVTSSGLNGIVRAGTGRRRGKRRGPWAYTTPEARSQRRKGKLREVLATCEANELAEVAGPAVAGVLSLWDLLLLRVEAVRAEESYVVTLCDELQSLLEKVQAVASEILKPLDVKAENKEHQLELQDKLLCATLGLASGTYLVDDRKLQHFSRTKAPPVEQTVKRMRMNAQDNDQTENEGTKTGSVIVNHDVMEECTVKSGGIDNDHVTKNKETDCPEVLSALTLVAKSTLGQGPERAQSHVLARTSGDDSSKVVGEVTKSEVFLLSGESSDMCVKLASGSDGHVISSGRSLHQPDHPSEFPNSDQQTQDLQTVDDIVNERLKNLTGGTSLVDFSVAASMNVVSTSSIDIPKPSIVSSQDLIDRLGQFRSLRLPNDITSNAVSSFDPEMALAAMGEGEPDTVSASNQHFPSTLQQIETVPSDSGSSFDPEVALAAMGEGEQSASVPSQHTSYQQIENVPDGSAFTPEDALVAMGEGEPSTVAGATCGQFQNTLPQIADITRGPGPPFVPEMALAAMGEGEQVTNGRSTENQFQSDLPQISMDMSDNNGTSFDPDVALAAMGEGNRSPANEMQDQFSVASVSGNTYSSGMDLGDIGDTETDKSVPQCTESVTNVSRFVPDMALAAMEEGQTITASESAHIPYQPPLPQSSTSSEPGSSFDPEMALAAITERDSVQTCSSSQRAHASVPIVNSGAFQLQCAPDLGLADTSMDVSLDESGPELDFEVLSEEFNRNTRHR